MAVLLLNYCFNGCNNCRNISDSTPRSDSLRGVASPRSESLRGVGTPRSDSLRGVTYICELLCEFATIRKNRLAC
jgi:hypothetical protein